MVDEVGAAVSGVSRMGVIPKSVSGMRARGGGGVLRAVVGLRQSQVNVPETQV